MNSPKTHATATKKSKMTNINLTISKYLVVINLLLSVVVLFLYDITIFYNLQIGFISSSLVMLGSMMSYAKMVNTRVEHNIITVDEDKDVIDLVEDPYHLYDDEEIINDENADLVETIKEERANLKANKRSLSQTLKESRAFLSFYRLGAYLLLILGFLYLNRHQMLDITTYLLALGIAPLTIVVLLTFFSKK